MANRTTTLYIRIIKNGKSSFCKLSTIPRVALSLNTGCGPHRRGVIDAFFVVLRFAIDHRVRINPPICDYAAGAAVFAGSARRNADSLGGRRTLICGSIILNHRAIDPPEERSR